MNKQRSVISHDSIRLVPRRLVLTAIVLGLSVFNQAHATSLGARAGTMGIGVELSKDLHKKLNSRFGINTFSLSLDNSYDGVDYKADVTLQSVSALLDWHPFAGKFFLSGGMVLNNSSVAIYNKDGTQTFSWGGNDYITNDMKLNGDVSFQPFAPYIGMGWFAAPSTRGSFGFSAELGVMYSGAPDINITASGSAANQNNPTNFFNVAADPTFQQDLTDEEHKLEEDYKKYRFYPVLSLGVTYAF